MLVTLSGISIEAPLPLGPTEVREPQRSKAKSPMLVTLSGMLTEVREKQLEKAEMSMLVTLSGIVIEVREVQPPKATQPILVTLSGITVFLHPAISVFVAVSMIALQLFLLSYFVLPATTLMEVREEQRPKATWVNILSLNASISDDDSEERSFEENIPDEHSKTPEQIYIEKENLSEIHDALNRISARERDYLCYRFGFDDDEYHDKTETADHFIMSKSWAGKLEKTALDNFRVYPKNCVNLHNGVE